MSYEQCVRNRVVPLQRETKRDEDGKKRLYQGNELWERHCR